MRGQAGMAPTCQLTENNCEIMELRDCEKTVTGNNFYTNSTF